jgi:hypothetical protein
LNTVRPIACAVAATYFSTGTIWIPTRGKNISPSLSQPLQATS